MASCMDLKSFENCVYDHEQIIANALNLKKVKDIHFQDYWGAVKSLGAWGGDFALVTSNKSVKETKEYFRLRGFETVMGFDELISQRNTDEMNTQYINDDEQLRI